MHTRVHRMDEMRARAAAASVGVIYVTGLSIKTAGKFVAEIRIYFPIYMCGVCVCVCVC